METRQATRDLCQMLLEGKSELVWKFDVDAIMQMCMLFLVNQQLTHTHTTSHNKIWKSGIICMFCIMLNVQQGLLCYHEQLHSAVWHPKFSSAAEVVCSSSHLRIALKKSSLSTDQCRINAGSVLSALLFSQLLNSFLTLPHFVF